MQRRLITATAAIAMAVSGWANSLQAQALSGDPDQNHKAGVSAGKEVSGDVGIRSSDTNGGAQTGATGQQAISPRTNLPMADSDGIRRTLSQVTESTIKPDGLGQLSQYIAGEDANRLRDLAQKNSILDQQIQTFQRNWQQKYKQDFAIKDQQLVLNDRSVRIVPGAIASGSATSNQKDSGAAGTAAAGTDATGSGSTGTGATGTGATGTDATAAQSKTGTRNQTAAGVSNANPTAANTTNGNANETQPTAVNPNPTAANSQTPNPNPTAANNNAVTGTGAAATDATPASSRQPAGSVGATGAGTGATGANASASNNVATVLIPASHNMPEASVVLSREASANAAAAGGATAETWKIDLPDSVDARQLQQNLSRQLRSLNEAQATWPAQANEAYNMVTHAIVLALSQPGQYAPEPGNRNPNLNQPRTNQQQKGAAKSGVGGGTGSTGAATSVGGPGAGTTGAGSTGSQSTGQGPSDNNTTGAGSTGSGGQNP